MYLTVSEKIRLLINRNHITLGELATRTGQSRQNLSNKMSRNNFTEKDIQELAKALDCTAEISFILPDGEKI